MTLYRPEWPYITLNVPISRFTTLHDPNTRNDPISLHSNTLFVTERVQEQIKGIPHEICPEEVSLSFRSSKDLAKKRIWLWCVPMRYLFLRVSWHSRGHVQRKTYELFPESYRFKLCQGGTDEYNQLPTFEEIISTEVVFFSILESDYDNNVILLTYHSLYSSYHSKHSV